MNGWLGTALGLALIASTAAVAPAEAGAHMGGGAVGGFHGGGFHGGPRAGALHGFDHFGFRRGFQERFAMQSAHRGFGIGFEGGPWGYGSFASDFPDEFGSDDWDDDSGMADDLPTGEDAMSDRASANEATNSWQPPDVRYAYSQRGNDDGRRASGPRRFWRNHRVGQPDDAGYWQLVRREPWRGYSQTY